MCTGATHDGLPAGGLGRRSWSLGGRQTATARGQYSARRGQYRVIYEIDDDHIVTVLVISHRCDAYS